VSTQGMLFHPNREPTCPVPTPAAPFARGSETSRKAAASIAGRSRSQRQKLLEFFRLRGIHGATDEEAAEFLKMSGNTLRPRRLELVASGLIVETNHTRLTRSGRRAVVHAIAAAVAVDPSPAEPTPF
jgi:hypothetical protein